MIVIPIQDISDMEAILNVLMSALAAIFKIGRHAIVLLNSSWTMGPIVLIPAPWYMFLRSRITMKTCSIWLDDYICPFGGHLEKNKAAMHTYKCVYFILLVSATFFMETFLPRKYLYKI